MISKTICFQMEIGMMISQTIRVVRIAYFWRAIDLSVLVFHAPCALALPLRAPHACCLIRLPPRASRVGFFTAVLLRPSAAGRCSVSTILGAPPADPSDLGRDHGSGPGAPALPGLRAGRCSSSSHVTYRSRMFCAVPDPLPTLAKGWRAIHGLLTMVGAFSRHLPAGARSPRVLGFSGIGYVVGTKP